VKAQDVGTDGSPLLPLAPEQTAGHGYAARQELDGKVRCVPDGPEHLVRRAGCALRGIGCRPERCSSEHGPTLGPSLVSNESFVDEQPCTVDGDMRVDDHPREALERADRPAELVAFAGVGARLLHKTVGQAHQLARCEQDPRSSQRFAVHPLGSRNRGYTGQFDRRRRHAGRGTQRLKMHARGVRLYGAPSPAVVWNEQQLARPGRRPEGHSAIDTSVALSMHYDLFTQCTRPPTLGAVSHANRTSGSRSVLGLPQRRRRPMASERTNHRRGRS
jgi:hypothetical protein